MPIALRAACRPAQARHLRTAAESLQMRPKIQAKKQLTVFFFFAKVQLKRGAKTCAMRMKVALRQHCWARRGRLADLPTLRRHVPHRAPKAVLGINPRFDGKRSTATVR